MLAISNRRIIGFDLCEVAPGKSDEWDANVGARVLYKLCIYSSLNSKKQII
jgi:agmatinase